MKATEIADYGLDGCAVGVDYLKAQPITGVEGIVTNPPYKLAVQFAEKALREVPYLALLLRTNCLESTARLPFFRKYPPARIWISSRRLPMMHRHGWAVHHTCQRQPLNCSPSPSIANFCIASIGGRCQYRSNSGRSFNTTVLHHPRRDLATSENVDVRAEGGGEPELRPGQTGRPGGGGRRNAANLRGGIMKRAPSVKRREPRSS